MLGVGGQKQRTGFYKIGDVYEELKTHIPQTKFNEPKKFFVPKIITIVNETPGVDLQDSDHLPEPLPFTSSK